MSPQTFPKSSQNGVQISESPACFSTLAAHAAQDGPNGAKSIPKSSPRGPKIRPRRPQGGQKCHQGCQNDQSVPPDGPNGVKSTTRRPRTIQREQKVPTRCPKQPKRSKKCHQKRARSRTGSRMRPATKHMAKRPQDEISPTLHT